METIDNRLHHLKPADSPRFYIKHKNLMIFQEHINMNFLYGQLFHMGFFLVQSSALCTTDTSRGY